MKSRSALGSGATLLVIAALVVCLSQASLVSARAAGSLFRSPVFLNPSGRLEWNGECTQTQDCTANAPCRPAPSTTVNGVCDIVFTSGDYAQLPLITLKNGAFGDFDVLFNGSINSLMLSVTTIAPKLKSIDYNPATLTKCGLFFTLSKNIVITFERLSFVDSWMASDSKSTAESGSSWNLQNCQIRMTGGNAGSSTSFISLMRSGSSSTPTDHFFNFQSVTADLDSNVLVTSNVNIASAIVSSSTINRPLALFILWGPPASIGALQVTDASSVTNVVLTLVSFHAQSTQSTQLTSSEIVHSASASATGQPILLVSGSVVTGASTFSGPTRPRLSTSAMSLFMYNAKISDMNVNCKTDSWTDAGQGPMGTNVQSLTNVTIHNCGSCFGASPSMDFVSFTYQTEEKATVFTYFSRVVGSLEKVNFTSISADPRRPWAASTERVIFDKDFNLIGSSSIISNATMYIKAGTRATFLNLNLTGVVAMEDKSILTGVSSNWTLHYPLTFMSVGSGAGGAAPTAQVDLSYLDNINVELTLDFVRNPIASLITAPPSIAVHIVGALMWKQMHISWNPALGAPTRGNYNIGLFRLESQNGYPKQFSADCAHYPGDIYNFVGTSQLDVLSGWYHATFSQK